MRNIDTLMKKTAPEWWYNYKKDKTFAAADKEIKMGKMQNGRGFQHISSKHLV